MLASWMDPSLLAPGDDPHSDRDWSAWELHSIRLAGDDWFETAYQALWNEFSGAHEMESREVIARRLDRGGDYPSADWRLTYELCAVSEGPVLAAVRDHTVMLPEREEPGGYAAVVHLSHNLVLPDWRRTGLAGWMRALPVASARRLTGGKSGRVLLLAEMEYVRDEEPATAIRLKAYQKAGFRKVDPSLVHYLQPDFRDAKEIDRTGVQPIPLTLVLMQAGVEPLTEISGRDLRVAVQALYAMYAAEFREVDMEPCRASLKSYPEDSEIIRLLPPAE